MQQMLLQVCSHPKVDIGWYRDGIYWRCPKLRQQYQMFCIFFLHSSLLIQSRKRFQFHSLHSLPSSLSRPVSSSLFVPFICACSSSLPNICGPRQGLRTFVQGTNRIIHHPVNSHTNCHDLPIFPLITIKSDPSTANIHQYSNISQDSDG